MRLIVIIFAALCLLQRLLMGVQPMPGGARIMWNAPPNPGWSNVSYAVWLYPQGSTNAQWLTNTTQTSYFYAGSITGQMFGVTTLAMSNGVPRESDVGFVHSPPGYATNDILRFIGPSIARELQASTNGAAGPWSVMVVFSNQPPLHLSAAGQQWFRTRTVFLPPPLP